MKRLEHTNEEEELTEEQKEFDAYDNELLNNILSIPNSTPKSEPKPGAMCGFYSMRHHLFFTKNGRGGRGCISIPIT